MKFRPILFSTLMVQALLAGTKTQTRRLVKPQPESEAKFSALIVDQSHARFWIDNRTLSDPAADPMIADVKVPYQIGDVLWVRETFLDAEDYACSDYDPEDPESEPRFSYRADCPKDQWSVYHWKPSLFMPAEAARIFLKVTSIRVERLQDISEADAIAEGITVVDKLNDGTHYHYEVAGSDIYSISPATTYQKLWEKINGNGSWDENPFVWVYEFERIEKPNNFPDVGKIAEKRAKTAKIGSKIAKNVN
ncbi:hypothetical protein [Spirosoma oryzicola]|uniref:hypothetical protein n=1 Tax=Spirosoma oryzicola TaxID=2898794 RepID=UPI001E3CCFB2|nr:hypothetical protein [Spirosoma oryzicola]UHG93290.1 hypothetical protein LQ777_10395 [Spirosoma oryzicola]